MPIFEYVCGNCSHRFESLVTRGQAPPCPACQSEQIQKQLSVFAVAVKAAPRAPSAAPCGACGDPRGAGACALD